MDFFSFVLILARASQHQSNSSHNNHRRTLDHLSMQTRHSSYSYKMIQTCIALLLLFEMGVSGFTHHSNKYLVSGSRHEYPLVSRHQIRRIHSLKSHTVEKIRKRPLRFMGVDDDSDSDGNSDQDIVIIRGEGDLADIDEELWEDIEGSKPPEWMVLKEVRIMHFVNEFHTLIRNR